MAARRRGRWGADPPAGSRGGEAGLEESRRQGRRGVSPPVPGRVARRGGRQGRRGASPRGAGHAEGRPPGRRLASRGGTEGRGSGASIHAEGRGSRAEGRGSGASIRSSGGGRSSGRGWICRAELGWRRPELERTQPPAVGVGEARERVEGKERRGDEEGAGTTKAREARPSSLLACSVKSSFWSFRGWENQTPFGGAWGFWSFLEKQNLPQTGPYLVTD